MVPEELSTCSRAGEMRSMKATAPSPAGFLEPSAQSLHFTITSGIEDEIALELQPSRAWIEEPAAQGAADAEGLSRGSYDWS